MKRRRDYGKTDWEWSMFDPEAKRLRRETVFPRERKRAYDIGAALFKEESLKPAPHDAIKPPWLRALMPGPDARQNNA